MAVTDYTWLDQADVLDELRVDGATSEHVDSVERARMAAASYVEAHRQDLMADTDGDDVADTFQPTDAVVHGAILLAGRLYQRRDSRLGLVNFGELGASEVIRLDPDIERLLGLGRYASPVVA